MITAVGILLMVIWAVWFFTADITIYGVSDRATLKQDHNALHVSTARSGKVIAINAKLGDKLEPGDVIIELDTAAASLNLAGDTRVKESLSAQRESLDRERALLDKGFKQDKSALAEQLELLRQRYQLKLSNQQIQADVTARYERLLEMQQSSQLDYLSAKRTYQQMAEAALEVKAEIRTIEGRLEQLASEYQMAVTELDQHKSNIQRQQAETDTRVQQHSLALDEQQLRAPIAGTLASLADIHEGEMLAAGQQLGTIQAEGSIGVQALFPPARALGHIRPGQRARVKLDGFAWSRYGQIDARVERVASAVQDEQILVQLSLDGEMPAGLPLLHDLPASVEITTGSKTPFELLLQRAGEILEETATALPATTPDEAGQ